MGLVSDDGWRIVNADTTIVAQEPRLSDVKPAVRESMAGLLGISVERVNVKAKTGEGCGPVGRGEVIEAYGIVMLERDIE